MPIEHEMPLNSAAQANSESVTEHSVATPHTAAGITAIVPARNEETVIAACVDSLAKQREITEIVIVNDQSSDDTARIVRDLATRIAKLRLLEAQEPPSGWVGKNNAVTIGARNAKSEWLLFTDADVELEEGATARALRIAQENHAALVSFSPEQITEKWYEKALIPFVYCRLARRFSYATVNDPKSVAAANGQFLLIRREVYEAIGGHARFASDVLEDVALATAVKAAGHRLWFGPGKGIVRARMYRTFGAMWEGWTKNLYRLMGGTPWKAFRESESAFPWIPLVVILLGIKFPIAMFAGVLLLVLRQMNYGSELVRNQYPFAFIIYYIPAAFLYAGVLAASYRSFARGKVQWKGREYSTETGDEKK
ncbi:MAG TPA: glycosyltransferase family 2 protein [Methylomirabilota bacterium]|jgi:glycosyltransferase involved in cell wall biosynthesis|nr:glycosyltransferase family 2 protein [Methylomirabilota bacterium]